MHKNFALTLLIAAACAHTNVNAAIECLMPNGKLMHLQLSAKCPTDAIGSRDPALDTAAPPAKPDIIRMGKNGHMATIRQQQFGSDWPFYVDHGTLTCRRPLHGPNMHAVFFLHKDKAYPINGIAKQMTMESPGDLGAIWRNDPHAPGLKVPVSGLIELGLSLCD
jgi:hypothetical protein